MFALTYNHSDEEEKVEEEEATLCPERQAEIDAEWRVLQQSKPGRFGGRGKPSPEVIQSNRAYKNKLKEWRRSFEDKNSLELDYVDDLLKPKKRK